MFDTNGKYETQWKNLHRPCGLYMPRGKCPHCFIGELGPSMAINRGIPNLGPRLSIVTNEGKLVARLGGEDGLAIDSNGDIYVGEVAYINWPSSFGEDVPTLKWLRTLQKLEKLP